MARLPLNVLVFPFRRGRDGLEYALFRRSDDADFWQAVAGGAEDGETAWEAARRELIEEAGIAAPPESWIALDSRSSVPATEFRDHALWGPSTFVVHVQAFGVDASHAGEIALSVEHTQQLWLDFQRASDVMRYDHTALWELNQRLTRAMAESPT
ncbi:MAG: NUDIX hydrolase [Caulobacteraceae bacterium]